MDFPALVNELLANERLLANLIGINVVLGALLVLSIALRKTLRHSTHALIRWSEMHWLRPLHERAHRTLGRILFWLTLTLMFVACVGTAVYHYGSRRSRPASASSTSATAPARTSPAGCCDARCRRRTAT